MTRGQDSQILPALSAHAVSNSVLSSSPLPISATLQPSTFSHSAASPARLPQSESAVPSVTRGDAISAVGSSEVQAGSFQSSSSFRVLYLFAGAARYNGVGAELHAMLRGGDVKVTVDEIDLCRGSHHDLLDPAVWAKVESSLKAGVYQMVIASPPCNTWSRSTFNAKAGPRPLRSAVHLWGGGPLAERPP